MSMDWLITSVAECNVKDCTLFRLIYIVAMIHVLDGLFETAFFRELKKALYRLLGQKVLREINQDVFENRMKLVKPIGITCKSFPKRKCLHFKKVRRHFAPGDGFSGVDRRKHARLGLVTKIDIGAQSKG